MLFGTDIIAAIIITVVGAGATAIVSNYIPIQAT